MLSPRKRKDSVFVVEWASGGGAWIDGGDWSDADLYLRQGSAMAQAFVEDLVAAGFEVTLLIDARNRYSAFSCQARQRSIASAAEFWRALREEAERADWYLVIAPECGDRLLQCHASLSGLAVKSLSPVGEFLKTASSKHATCDRLLRAGVQRLQGMIFDAGVDPWPPRLKPPVIIKPDDGAGGERLLVATWDDLVRPGAGQWRIEPWIPGVAVSIVAWCGPRGICWTVPMKQRFDPATGEYVGGAFPLPEELALRAERLAATVLDALGPTQGYVGLDLVLADDSADDAVVDVNPRLTCSYVGLRQIYASNLAASLVRIRRGQVVELERRQAALEFFVLGPMEKSKSS